MNETPLQSPTKRRLVATTALLTGDFGERADATRPPSFPEEAFLAAEVRVPYVVRADRVLVRRGGQNATSSMHENFWAGLVSSGSAVGEFDSPLREFHTNTLKPALNVLTLLALVKATQAEHTRGMAGMPDATAAPDANADLRAALIDLDEASDEAREEGFPALSERALGDARRLLKDLYRMHPCRLEVYPTPDAEIALVAPGGDDRSVMVLCASDGGALCTVNIDGRLRYARYPSAARLPDGFVREGMRDLVRARSH